MERSEPEPADEASSPIPARLEPADAFFVVTVLGSLVAIAAGAIDEASFLGATLIAILVLRRLELPPLFELCFATGIVLQGWGNALLLFERIDWYDKAVHFLTPMLIVPSLYLLLARAGAVPSPSGNDLKRAALGLLVVMIALGTSLAAIWELIEGSADLLLGTSLAHGYYETIADLYASLFGSVAAGAVLAWWAATGGRDLPAQGVSTEATAEAE
jgi:hypothetical protein